MSNTQNPLSSLASEKNVLACIILAETQDMRKRFCLHCQDKNLTEKSFVDPMAKELFRAITCLFEQGIMPDPVEVLDYLAKKKKLTAAYDEFMTSLQTDNITSDFESHVYALKDLEKRRDFERAVQICLNHIRDRNYLNDADSVIADTYLAIKEHLSKGSSSAAFADMVKEQSDAIIKQMDSGRHLEGLSTGQIEVDAIMGGMRPAEMIVIGARPSVGKTSFAMNIAECVAQGRMIDGTKMEGDGKQHPVMVFSLEMSTEALVRRMIFSHSGVRQTRVQKGLLAKTQKAEMKSKIEAVNKDLHALPIIIDDTPGLDIRQLRAKALREQWEHKIELVIIDYLTLCRYSENGRSVGFYEQVTYISQQIKAMAKDLNIPVIVLSQLSRKTSDREGNATRDDGYETPKMSDLRESGSIEQDADVVILLHKQKPEGRLDATAATEGDTIDVVVNVAKNRNGDTGSVVLPFVKPLMRFGVTVDC